MHNFAQSTTKSESIKWHFQTPSDSKPYYTLLDGQRGVAASNSTVSFQHLFCVFCSKMFTKLICNTK